MKVNDSVIKQEQKVAKLEKNLALQKLKSRRADTRHKIEFGGLVIKSKISKYSKAVILGALIDAFENIEKDKSTELLFRLKGEASFMEYGETKK